MRPKDLSSGVARASWLAALLAVGSVQGAYAQALAGPLYVESYSDEQGFPTTPEIDRLGLGGMGGFVTVPTGDITVDQGVVTAHVTGGAAGIGMGIGGLAVNRPTAFFARFEEFVVGQPPGESAVIAGSSDLNYQVQAAYFAYWGNGAQLEIYEIFNGTFLQVRVIPVPFTTGPYDLELVLDPAGSGSALVRVSVNGETFETPPMTLQAYRPPELFVQFIADFTNSGISAKLGGLCFSGLKGSQACPVLLDHLNPRH